jgi:hypothetical protein
VKRGNSAGAEVTRVFVADALLPVQVVRPPADRWLPRLCLALREDALQCPEVRAVRSTRVVARARCKREAWHWMMADAEDCLSFTAVCSECSISMLRQSGRGSDSALPAQLHRLACRANYSTPSPVLPR